MRSGAPGRAERQIGSFPDLSSAAAREAAVKAVRADRFAASARAGVEPRRTFADKALAQWNQEPYPPSVEKLERVATTLKAGGTARRRRA